MPVTHDVAPTEPDVDDLLAPRSRRFTTGVVAALGFVTSVSCAVAALFTNGEVLYSTAAVFGLVVWRLLRRR